MSEETPPNIVRYKRYEVACDAKGRPIQLAHGGMGVTYKARDPKLDCTVVLKIVGELLQSDEASLARFRREARKLAQLRDHPHIGTLFDFDEQDGKDFYVMEYIDGEDLATRVRREGPLSPRDALIVLKQVSSALTAMWARSLVHRDIKPANIMALRDKGQGLFVKLIDFGLAKDIESTSEATQVTQTGEHGGMSVFYASPEQIRAQQLDIRSDLYSLGVTMWFLLTGKTPFGGTSMWEVTNKQLHDAPPLDALPPRTPPAVRDLLSRLLAKKAEDRPSEPTKVEAEAAKILEMLPATSGVPLGDADTVAGGDLPGAEHFRSTDPMPDLGDTRPLDEAALPTEPLPAQPQPPPAKPTDPAPALLAASTAMRSMEGSTTIPISSRPAKNFEPPLFTTSTFTRALERGPRLRWPLVAAAAGGIFVLALLGRWIFYPGKAPTVPPVTAAAGPAVTPTPSASTAAAPAASSPVPTPLASATPVAGNPATPPPASPAPTDTAGAPVVSPSPGVLTASPDPNATPGASPAATPAGSGFTNSLGMRFVPVPGTKVQMCVHETRLVDFRAWVEEAALPPSRFREMLAMTSNGWSTRDGFDWRNPGFPQGEDHPVVGVSWNDAVEYAAWLTQRERTREVLRPKQRYRLPSDEEWSRAVGLQPEPGATPKERDSKIKRVYPWGEEWPPRKAHGNYRGPEAVIGQERDEPNRRYGPDDSFARTAPVMKFAPNALGLYDLGGNVMEWCLDWFDGSRKHKTLRGAGWFDFDADMLQSSFRNGALPTYRQAGVGFRLVLVEDQ